MSGLTRKEEQILLAIYQIKENCYLIPIREQIKKFTGKTYSVGTIYAPLNRLHMNGYLESYVKKPGSPGSGKPIKYYKLTKKGYEALAELKRQNEMMWEGFALPVFEK
jgi:PadR family transcriptional regulator PadR